MKGLGYIAAPLLIAMSGTAAAQAIDDNWDGPDVPVVERLPEGGIKYTGKWIARRVLIKNDDTYTAIHKKGFPRVVLQRDGQLFAVMTQKSLGYIDSFWGGDGHVPAYEGEIELFNPDVWSDEDRTAKLPEATDKVVSLDDVPERPGAINLDTVAAETGPTELFSDDEIGAINPRDGKWLSAVDTIDVNGCPPGVESAALAMMGGGSAVTVSFSRPWWSPGDFSAEFARQTWRPVGANGYFSVPFKTGPEASGSGMSMAVTMAMNARSTEHIDVWARVNLKLSAALAQIAGGSTDCVAIVNGTYKRQ